MSYGSGIWFNFSELDQNSVPKIQTAPELSSEIVELVIGTYEISSGSNFSSILKSQCTSLGQF